MPGPLIDTGPPSVLPMSDGLIISDAAHRHALQRFAATSKRTAAEVLKQEAKLTFALVAKMTPPGSQDVAGRAAEVQGKNKVIGDIRSLYGTAGDAYDRISSSNTRAAGAFWKHYQAREMAQAASIVRQETGVSFSRFDGGALHSRVRTRRGSVNRRKQHVFFVQDPAELEAYIAKRQGNVWWLAGGWAAALRTLGAKLPYGVGKHASPGSIRVRVTDSVIEITASNEVYFAGQVKGMDRRIRSALRIRSEVLQRRWDAYLKRLANPGLKIA